MVLEMHPKAVGSLTLVPGSVNLHVDGRDAVEFAEKALWQFCVGRNCSRIIAQCFGERPFDVHFSTHDAPVAIELRFLSTLMITNSGSIIIFSS